MHRVHSGLTVAAAIKNGHSDHLNNLLSDIKEGRRPGLFDFEHSSSTLFVSIVMLPAADYFKEPLPETLVFSTTYCGPLNNHITDLLCMSSRGLIEIFKHCVGFETGDAGSYNNLIHFILKHQHKSAFNSRYNCFSKLDVQKEQELRNEIGRYIDKAQSLNALDRLTALEVKTLIQKHIETRGDDYEWAHTRGRMTLQESAIVNKGPIGASLFMLATAYFLWHRPRYIKWVIGGSLITALLLIAVVRYISKDKNETAVRPDLHHLKKIAASQLRPVINEMTAAGPLKKGFLRRYFYTYSLRIIALFAPRLMKVPTVGSIRWLTIDKKRRLLFMANYSNATDFYVRDFLNGSTPRGVNFMFTNGQGFPDAKMLIYGGITDDPEGYMNAVHKGQLPSQYSYEHQPLLTSDIIQRNRLIRNGLFRDMDEEEAGKWLKLL